MSVRSQTSAAGGVILVKKAAAPPQGRLEQAAQGAEVVQVEAFTRAACDDVGLGADRVIAALGASASDDLSFLPNLRWVHSATAGVDAWLSEGVLSTGLTLTSAVGNGAVPLAEHAMMLMLMLNRDALRWVRAQERRIWDRYEHGELAGTSLGIVGYGKSGADLAAKALAFHMHVRAMRRTPGARRDGEVELLYGREGLAELLRHSDFVVVTAPATAETRGMIGAAQLAQMKRTAFLVVVSRGGIVSDDALISALQSGVIAGAGLDAHGVEPLSPESPFWALSNVIITPHNGATTSGTRERGADILLENLSRWVAGAELVNVVDPTRGY